MVLERLKYGCMFWAVGSKRLLERSEDDTLFGILWIDEHLPDVVADLALFPRYFHSFVSRVKIDRAQALKALKVRHKFVIRGMINVTKQSISVLSAQRMRGAGVIYAMVFVTE